MKKKEKEKKVEKKIEKKIIKNALPGIDIPEDEIPGVK